MRRLAALLIVLLHVSAIAEWRVADGCSMCSGPCRCACAAADGRCALRSGGCGSASDSSAAAAPVALAILPPPIAVIAADETRAIGPVIGVAPDGPAPAPLDHPPQLNS